MAFSSFADHVVSRCNRCGAWHWAWKMIRRCGLSIDNREQCEGILTTVSRRMQDAAAAACAVGGTQAVAVLLRDWRSAADGSEPDASVRTWCVEDEELGRWAAVKVQR